MKISLILNIKMPTDISDRNNCTAFDLHVASIPFTKFRVKWPFTSHGKRACLTVCACGFGFTVNLFFVSFFDF